MRGFIFMRKRLYILNKVHFDTLTKSIGNGILYFYLISDVINKSNESTDIFEVKKYLFILILFVFSLSKAFYKQLKRVNRKKMKNYQK